MSEFLKQRNTQALGYSPEMVFKVNLCPMAQTAEGDIDV